MSEATLEMPPSRTMMKVIKRRGATLTILRIRAAIRPASSATPTPIMATRMTATTPKSLKFCTAVVKMKRMPSPVSRLSAVIRSSSRW